ncbi:hypothetical protein IJ732_04875 [bacterium]|nr:hypothetical protein [bacterium]
MTLGVSAMDFNTARYIQSVQAADNLSNSAVNSIYNQSIFGNNGFGTFGYSSIPFAGYGVNTAQMLEYQQQYTDASLAMNRKNKAATQLSTANDDSVSRQVAALQRQVQGNKQENIQQEYGKLLESVRELYEDAGYANTSEAQIKATAEKMYAQITGNALIDDIKAHGDSSFTQGWKKVVTFGISSGKSANENIQAITGENANNAESVAGKAAGMVAGGATLAFAGRQIFKFVKSPAAKSVWNVIKKVL